MHIKKILTLFLVLAYDYFCYASEFNFDPLFPTSQNEKLPLSVKNSHTDPLTEISLSCYILSRPFVVDEVKNKSVSLGCLVEDKSHLVDRQEDLLDAISFLFNQENSICLSEEILNEEQSRIKILSSEESERGVWNIEERKSITERALKILAREPVVVDNENQKLCEKYINYRGILEGFETYPFNRSLYSFFMLSAEKFPTCSTYESKIKVLGSGKAFSRPESIVLFGKAMGQVKLLNIDKDDSLKISKDFFSSIDNFLNEHKANIASKEEGIQECHLGLMNSYVSEDYTCKKGYLVLSKVPEILPELLRLSRSDVMNEKYNIVVLSGVTKNKKDVQCAVFPAYNRFFYYMEEYSC